MPPTVPVRKTPDKAAMQKILTGDTYATVLLTLFADTAGDEKHNGEKLGLKVLHWHPRTIRDYVDNAWDVTLTQTNFDKLMAGIAIVTTDLFFTNVDRFIKLCNVLCGSPLNPRVFEAADALECAWGCTEALLLDPPDDKNPEPFHSEVRHYIAQVLDDEGFVNPPDILKIALGSDRSAQVAHAYRDDPETLRAIVAVQAEKNQEVENMLKGNLLALVGQLSALPLKHGDTHDLEKRVSKLIQDTTASRQE
jgi:hypothetical protein